MFVALTDEMEIITKQRERERIYSSRTVLSVGLLLQ